MSARRIAIALTILIGLTASVLWWAMTMREPGRMIFLPGGDVGLGFKSYAGRLQWIEYAPWDPRNLDYPWWSIPWVVVVSAETLALVAVARVPRVLRITLSRIARNRAGAAGRDGV